MRLEPSEIEWIKATVAETVGEAKIYLFGSRTNDTKRGGDIDLYIVATRQDYRSKITIQAKLERRLGKPVDMVLHRDFERPIEQEGLKGVLL